MPHNLQDDDLDVASSLDEVDLTEFMEKPQFKKPDLVNDTYDLTLAASQDHLYDHQDNEDLGRKGSVATNYSGNHDPTTPKIEDKPINAMRAWYVYHRPKNFYRRLFIGISVLSAMVVLALQIYIFVLYFVHLDSNSQTSLKKKAIATYLALFICAEIYQCIITISAIITKSRIQVFLLLSFIGCMVVYSGIQFVELKHSLSPSLAAPYRAAPQGAIIAITCLEIATFIAQSYLFFIHLRKDFGWNVFKKIGASPDALKRLNTYQLYRALLYFDGFFFPAFTLQFIIMMPKIETVEFVLTIIVIPISILLLIFADYSASNEILIGHFIAMFGYLLGLVYAFFKVIRIYTHNTDPHEYYPGRKSLTLFAVFSIILLLTTITFGIMVWKNFNKGLKPYVAKTFFGKKKKIQIPQENINIIDYNNDIVSNFDNYSLNQNHNNYNHNGVPGIVVN